MNDEESFVILGCSPMPSLCDKETTADEHVSDGPGSFSSLNRSEVLDEAKNSLQSPPADEAVANKTITESMRTTLLEAATSDLDIKSDKNYHDANSRQALDSQNVDSTQLISSCSIEETNSNIIESMESNESVKPNISTNPASGSLKNKEPTSLASSFILGEVNVDFLKASVYSQFPSICSMEACAEDVVKLQTIMTEYFDLKRTMAKVNDTMRQFYQQTKQWKESSQRKETQYQQQLDDCQSQIAALRNQNIELTRNLDLQTEHLRIMNEVHKKDNEALVQSLSEKTAQINNMRTFAEKLERQQMNSFVYLPKAEGATGGAQTEYVTFEEHQCVIKLLEERIKKLESENEELNQMKPNYIDQLNFLAVKLASAEELIKKFRADITLLQAQDIEKGELFKNNDLERDEMRKEISLLRQQVELYSKDFEIERNAREQLANEKQNLLQDIRALQVRNQELIQEAEKHVQRYVDYTSGAGVANAVNGRTTTSGTSAAIKAEATNVIRAQSSSYHSPHRAVRNLSTLNSIAYPDVVGRCPICSKHFPSLTTLQMHASSCFG